MQIDNEKREFTTQSIAQFSFELAGLALRAGVEAGLFNYDFDDRGLPLHRGSFPVTVSYNISNSVFGVARIERSDDYIFLGRVKYFNTYKMAWLNEDPDLDDHTPVATVEFLYDQRQREFLCGPHGPALTFKQDEIDDICGIGVLPPYKTPRRGA